MELRVKKKVLGIAILLNLIIVLSQIVAGIYSHSIALITDALHNFQDVVSLIIAFIAVIFIAKKPTSHMTFGYKRAESLAGFINSAVLVGAVIVIIITGIERLLFPEPVDSLIVIIVGLVAFVVNSLSAYLLGFHHHHNHHHHHHHHEEDLNIRAAYLHLLSDAMISLGVVIGGIAMYFLSIYWIDPVLSILFSLYILKETIPVLKKSVRILMEGVPEELDKEEIIKEIKSLDGKIKDVHDLHIWALSSKDIYLTGHIVVENQSLKQIEPLIKDIETKLAKFGINHITLQFETKNFNCEIRH